MFEKILVPIDGSEHSKRALEKAIQIAHEFHSQITLIHVYPVSVYVEEMRKIGESILADGGEKVKAEGIQVETLLLAGHTVDEILKTAKEGCFDLVVIGARGVSRIKEFLTGSVCDGVTRHACCPVLVVR